MTNKRELKFGKIVKYEQKGGCKSKKGAGEVNITYRE
jgi:hypothetical protein